MTDSTATYISGADSTMQACTAALPADSAFVSGTMELPHSGWRIPPSDGERPVSIDILVAVFVVLFILNIRKIINILPYIFGCMIRWKESLNVEYSMKTSRSRDDMALLFFVPFCLTASRYELLPYLNGQTSGDMASLLITTGAALAYIILRLGCNMLGRIGSCPADTYKVATMASRTFFCTASVFLLATAGIMSLTPASPDVARSVLLYELAFVYLTFILRKSQIFKNSCSLFSTILYLCILEILPTGIFVAAAMYLQ